MSRRVLAVFAFAALTLLHGQPLDRARIDAAVHKAMVDWGVPGAAVAIVRDDQVLLAEGYGVKELGKSAPVTANTLFAVGSTTKAFTTAAMAMLVDEGKMHWDDPVRKYVEFFHLSDPLADENVTLRDLICHRTGLSRNDMLWYNSPWTSEEIIRKIAFLKATKPFRSAWQYNNLMFLTAGFAVAQASGTTWEDFVRKRIFEPLGMISTDAGAAIAENAPDHASPHLRTDGKIGVIPWYHLDNIQPAGAIDSNVTDLAKWVQFQLGDGTWHGKRLISARNMTEMHTPQMAMRPEDWGRNYNPETHQMSYAMAWELQDYRGLHMISHGGAIDGFRANITLLPDQKTGIVVLSNLNQENMPESLRFTLIDIVLGLKERDWNGILLEHFGAETKRDAAETKKFLDSRVPNTMPTHELEAYRGEYVEPAYGTAMISVEDGKLAIQWSNFHQPLDHFHFDTFRVHNGRLDGVPVQFRLSADGAVNGMEFLGVEFEKRKSEHR